MPLKKKVKKTKVNFNLGSVSEDSSAVRGSFQSSKLSNSLAIPAFRQLSSSQELTRLPQAEEFMRTAFHESIQYINLCLPGGHSLKIIFLGEVAVEEDKDRFSSQLIEVEQNETAPNIISRLIGQRRREG